MLTNSHLLRKTASGDTIWLLISTSDFLKLSDQSKFVFPFPWFLLVEWVALPRIPMVKDVALGELWRQLVSHFPLSKVSGEIHQCFYGQIDALHLMHLQHCCYAGRGNYKPVVGSLKDSRILFENSISRAFCPNIGLFNHTILRQI